MLQATRSTNFRRTTTRTEILTRRDPGRLSSSFPLKDLFACRPRKRKLFSTLGGIAAVTAGITLAKPVALWLAEKLPSPISDMIQNTSPFLPTLVVGAYHILDHIKHLNAELAPNEQWRLRAQADAILLMLSFPLTNSQLLPMAKLWGAVHKHRISQISKDLPLKPLDNSDARICTYYLLDCITRMATTADNKNFFGLHWNVAYWCQLLMSPKNGEKDVTAADVHLLREVRRSVLQSNFEAAWSLVARAAKNIGFVVPGIVASFHTFVYSRKYVSPGWVLSKIFLNKKRMYDMVSLLLTTALADKLCFRYRMQEAGLNKSILPLCGLISGICTIPSVANLYHDRIRGIIVHLINSVASTIALDIIAPGSVVKAYLMRQMLSNLEATYSNTKLSPFAGMHGLLGLQVWLSIIGFNQLSIYIKQIAQNIYLTTAAAAYDY